MTNPAKIGHPTKVPPRPVIGDYVAYDEGKLTHIGIVDDVHASGFHVKGFFHRYTASTLGPVGWHPTDWTFSLEAWYGKRCRLMSAFEMSLYYADTSKPSPDSSAVEAKPPHEDRIGLRTEEIDWDAHKAFRGDMGW